LLAHVVGGVEANHPAKVEMSMNVLNGYTSQEAFNFAYGGNDSGLVSRR
jgi:hypothetical protein